MAKTIIRGCDICGAVDGTTREDGTTVTVRNTTIVGATKDVPRKDLCDADRLRILAAAGYAEDAAKAIVAEHDTEKTRKPKAAKETAEATETVPESEKPDAPVGVDGGPQNPSADVPETAKANGKAKVPAGAK